MRRGGGGAGSARARRSDRRSYRRGRIHLRLRLPVMNDGRRSTPPLSATPAAAGSAAAADIAAADDARVFARDARAAAGRADSCWLARLSRDERLRLLRNEAGLLPEIRVVFALVVAAHRWPLRHRRLWLRLVLPKLLLGGGDEAEIMFGMLIVVFGGHGIAGGARVAGELDVFFGNVGGSAADLDVGAVRFEHPCHRVLAAPVVIVVVVIIVVPVTHPLVVLTVSHVSPSIPALKFLALNCSLWWSRSTSFRRAPARTGSRCRSHACQFRQPSRSTKTRSPAASAHRPADQIIQPAKASPVLFA